MAEAVYTVADQEVEREARPGAGYDLQSLPLVTSFPLLINSLQIQIQITTHSLSPQTLEVTDRCFSVVRGNGAWWGRGSGKNSQVILGLALECCCGRNLGAGAETFGGSVTYPFSVCFRGSNVMLVGVEGTPPSHISGGHRVCL